MHFGKCTDDPKRCRALARSRAAGQDHHLACGCCFNGCKLNVVILHPGFRADVFDNLPIKTHMRCNANEMPQLCCDSDLCKVKGRQINGKRLRLILLQEEFRHQLLRFDVLCLLHFGKRCLKRLALNLKQLASAVKKHFPRCIAMPVFRKLIERIHKSAPKAFKPFLLKAHFCGNLVRGLKSDAPDIIRQTIGVFRYNPNALVPVDLINFGGMSNRDLMLLQKHHDVPNFLLGIPACLDLLDPSLPDPGNLTQLFRMLFNDREGFRSKAVYDLSRVDWPNALYKSRAQIFLDAKEAGRQGFLI